MLAPVPMAWLLPSEASYLEGAIYVTSLSPKQVLMYLIESPPSAVCNNVDIVARILSHVSWSTLNSFSRASRSTRLSSQDRGKALVVRALDPFVTHSEITRFAKLLRDRKGLVVGSVARRVFCFNEQWFERIAGQVYNEHDQSSDLNIIVSNTEFEAAIVDLEALGFTDFQDTNVYPHLCFRVLEVLTGTKVIHLASGEEQRLSVTLARAATSALGALLASCWTGQMNAISDARLYSFYPALTRANFSLRSDLKDDDYASGQRSVRLEFDNDDFKIACGKCCPALNRKSFGDEGVAIASWSRDGVHFCDSDSDELLNERCFVWRFTEFCHNPVCDFWSPPVACV
ncbi:hypothetical protein BKA70DRAFT_1431672 [Coprinopsis sp. MPI-PUGE-AT-0042]|nr:hypothetical protein BKA70DRAFT_1431672 [Coprinopsis sp. MPI-PUGE-AT-0042]